MCLLSTELRIMKPYRNSTLLLLLFFASLIVPVWSMTGTVSFDGKPPFPVESIFPDQEPHLEVQALARGMGWRAQILGKNVLLDSKPITNVIEYERKLYVNAAEVAEVFNLNISSKNNGLVIDYWSRTAIQPGEPSALSISVRKREKLSSPAPDYEQYRVTLQIKNNSGQASRGKAREFSVVDTAGQSYRCKGEFDFGVPGKATIVVDRLYFDLPKKANPDKLIYQSQGQSPVTVKL